MNNQNGITPDKAPEYIIEKGERVPAEYVVTDDGTVVTVPAGGLTRMTGRSGTDENGVEKRMLFRRRLNSVGLTLMLQQTLIGIVCVNLMPLAIIIWMLCRGVTMDNLTELLLEDSTNTGSLLMGLLTLFSVPVGNVLSGFIHSYRQKFTMGDTFRRGAKLGWTVPAAAVVALGVTYAWTFVFMLCGWLMPDSFIGRIDFTSDYADAGTAAMIVSALYVCIGAPLTEEILFRGVILKSLSKYGIPFAVFMSSLLFGLVHGNIFQAPFAFAAGIVLAYLAVRSGSLWPSILVHFVVNAFSTARDITSTLAPESWKSAVQFGFFGVGGLTVLGTVIILCTCARRISWKPVDPESNHILLPTVQTRVRCKPLFALLCGALMAVILIYTLMILFSSGVTFGIENMVPEAAF